MLSKFDNINLNIFIIIYKDNKNMKFIKKNLILKSDNSKSVKKENTKKTLKIKQKKKVY
jgi:hypothetical protein